MQDLSVLLEDLSNRTDPANVSRESRIQEMVAALAEFAASLYPEGSFEKQGERWVFTPQNFITFQALKTRDEVLVTLRGNPREFPVFEELPLAEYRTPSYSSCSITSPSQLMAASFYVYRAHQIFRRGRNRLRKGVLIKEVDI